MGARDDYEDEEEDFEDDEDFKAEEDEDLEDAEEDTQKKRRRSQFTDDMAEEDDEEDEEDDAPKRGKKVKSKRSMFIDDAAAVASDDEEEEEGEEEFIQDEEIGEIPNESERAPRHRAMSWQQEEDDEDLERIINERYGAQAMSSQYEEADTTEVEQQALLPSVKDPKLWMVKCQLGHEREAVVTLMQKYLNKENSNDALLIKSAVALDHLKGFIYVESDKESYVKQACTGLRLLYSYQIKLVPIKEMTEVLTIERKSVDLELNSWVRIKIGIYKGDLGQVLDVDTVKHSAIVKLVPRIDWEAVAAKLTGRRDFEKKRIRPPSRFFSQDEVEQLGLRVQRRRDQQTGDVIEHIDNLKFKDGYFLKAVSLKSLDTKAITPTLDELQRFQRALEGEDSSAGLTHNLNPKHRVRLHKGDMVQVVEGDLKGLKGKVEKVEDDEVIIMPLHKELKDPLPVKHRQLLKFFQVGDHVKVVAGQHQGSTGLIVNVEDQIVVILTDSAREQIKVFSRDIVGSAEVATGPAQFGDYELHDLVMIDRSSFGVIVKIEDSGCQVLLNHSERSQTQLFKLKDLQRKILDRKTVFSDRDGNQIAVKDVVRIMEGNFKGRTGTVEHLHGGVLFLFDRSFAENFGFVVVRARGCRAVAGKQAPQRRPVSQSSFGGTPVSYSPSQRSPYLGVVGARQGTGGRGGRGQYSGDGGRGRRRDEAMIGRTVKICGGPFKGYRGRVVDCTDSTVRVELESQMKIVTVRRDQLPEGDSFNSSSFDRETPRYGQGSETPLRAATRTPLHSGGFRDMPGTPMHAGMRTPMRDNAWNPNVPTTPLRNDGWDESDPSTWKPSGASGSFQGFTPSFSPLDPPPSTAPQHQNPPTPGIPNPRSYEAPTPAGAASWATGGTPGGRGFSEAPMSFPGPAPSPAPSPYPNPTTPGVGFPMSPAVPSLPMTPGGPPPSTPLGDVGVMEAATPAPFTGSTSLMLDLVVFFRCGPHEGQQGVVREVIHEDTFRVFLGSKGEGRPVVATDSEVEIVPPRKMDRFKVVGGEFKGRTGRLVQLDTVDGIAKLDGEDEVAQGMKAFELAELGKLEVEG